MSVPIHRVLVVDDDAELRSMLQEYLSRESFEVDRGNP